MAALVTPYSVGNQAAMIRQAFTPRSMAGLGNGTGITSQIIDAVTGFVTQRWGDQRGTIVMDAQGNIVQKQAAGMPINTAPPMYGGTNIQAPEGFATGMATGTLVLVGVGALVFVILMAKGKR